MQISSRKLGEELFITFCKILILYLQVYGDLDLDLL